MAKISVEKFLVSDADTRLIYNEIKALYTHFTYDELDVIFELALNNKSLFPDSSKTKDMNLKKYLTNWVESYRSEIICPPHAKIAKPKSSCSDPAIRIIVGLSQSLSEDCVLQMEKTHNLFMSAENLQGGLLEEYIAACTRPYGWIWCAGSTLRSIDFCTCNGLLLQVKNKSNTENSSSSTVRDGTTIHKWVRLSTSHKNKQPVPRYNWDRLNQIVNENRTKGFDLPPCNMSEESYTSYIASLIRANHTVITAE